MRAVRRPQRVPGAPLRFLLDVHLGTLARRLRCWASTRRTSARTSATRPSRRTRARDRRVLLSRDRGLLRRRELWAGAYVYSDRPEEQLDDVLSRFAPALTPWTRCVACNGDLEGATKESVSEFLEGGTERSYDVFAQCTACRRVYWNGAHHTRLQTIVEDALRTYGGAAAQAS